MGKVLKIALVVGAIAINFVPGVGQAISGAIVGALGGTFGALGVATAVVSGISALGLAAGLGMASKALGLGPKQPSISAASVDRLTANMIGTTPRTMVLGHTAAGTDIRYQAYTGADQEYYHQIIVCASHKLAAIEAINLEDKPAWTSGGGVTSDYSGYLTVDVVLEGSASNMINVDAVWNASNNRRLTGCAYLHIRYKLTGNSKKAESPFSSNVPNRMTIVAKGAYVYDPRRDSTVGGSGSMRANDQSTWAYAVGSDEIGRNAALAELWYLLGWRINGKLAVGRGVLPNRIDMASFIEAANLCDEAVTLTAAGTEPRYRFDGVFSEGDDGSSVRGVLETSMNAILRDAGGRLSLSVLHNDLSAPVISLTEADCVGAFVWEQTSPISDDRNIVRGRYTSPAALYQLVDYPSASIASQDGIDRILTLDLPGVQSLGQAQRLAKQQVERLKYLGTFSAPFNAKGWAAQVGKIVNFSFAPLGWVNKKFRVVQQTIQVDGVCELVLQIEDPAIYAWDREESPPITPPTPTRYDYLNNPMIGAGDGVPGASSFTLLNVYNTSITGPTTIVKTSGGNDWATPGRAASNESFTGVGFASGLLVPEQMIGITNDPLAGVSVAGGAMTYAIHRSSDGNVYAWVNGSVAHSFGPYTVDKNCSVYTDGKKVVFIAPDGTRWTTAPVVPSTEVLYFVALLYGEGSPLTNVVWAAVGPGGDDGLPGDEGPPGTDALTIPPPPTVDIACYSDGSVKPGQLDAYARIKVYVGTTDVTEAATYADGARSGCSSGVSNTSGTRGVLTFSAISADTGWAEVEVSYDGRSATIRVNIAKRKDATSPAAAYPAESIDLGTTTYTKSIPVANGATLSLVTEAHSDFMPSSSGSMSVSASHSVHGSGTWNTMSTSSPTTSSFAPLEPADVSATWTWTNSTGATVLIDVRVTISKTGGALTINNSKSYMQPQ